MENITTASCSPLLATKQNQEAALEGWRNREKGVVEPGVFCGSPHHRQLTPACGIHSVWVGGGGGGGGGVGWGSHDHHYCTAQRLTDAWEAGIAPV